MKIKVTKDRMRRALNVKVLDIDEWGTLLPANHYYALGGSEPHYLQTKPHWDCDCGDWNWRTGIICKHLLSALIYEDSPVLRGVLEMMGYDKSKNTI